MPGDIPNQFIGFPLVTSVVAFTAIPDWSETRLPDAPIRRSLVPVEPLPPEPVHRRIRIKRDTEAA